MKNKDDNWYEEKLQSIKKRKRNLNLIEDPKMRKRIKADLNREARGAKRSNKDQVKKLIKRKIDGLDND